MSKPKKMEKKAQKRPAKLSFEEVYDLFMNRSW